MGFEPTYRLITDNSISSRARYGLFATFPQRRIVHELLPAGKPFFPPLHARPEVDTGHRSGESQARTRFRPHARARLPPPATMFRHPARPAKQPQPGLFPTTGKVLPPMSRISRPSSGLRREKLRAAASFCRPCRHEAALSALPVRRNGDPCGAGQESAPPVPCRRYLPKNP